MATVEKRNIAPINPLARIDEADRSRVQATIRRHLADILTGSQSYFPDGLQRDERARLANIENFISSLESLRQHVDDPSDVLGEVRNDLRKFVERLDAQINEREPVDNIQIPPQQAPTTEDNNIIYVDPDGGPFSPSNPLSPNAQRRGYKEVLAPQQRPPQSGAILGLISGKPMPRRTIQPPIFFDLNSGSRRHV